MHFLPVRFGYQHQRRGDVSLYLIVDQQKIEIKKAEVFKETATQSMVPDTSRSAFEISVANLILFVNGRDLPRYLPDEQFNENQLT